MAHPTNQEAIKSALKNFDDLPNSAYVRIGVVRALNGNCSEATVYRMSQQGILPQPCKLGARMSGWNVGKLRQALAARTAK